jgi:HK97 gp10 family phage protein
MADVTVDTAGFDDAAAKFAKAMAKTLNTWAFEVERRAKQKSPVDTGFNLNSIYTVAIDGKMYSNQKPVGARPGNPNAVSTKGRKKYKPGSFAKMTEAGVQDLVGSIRGGNAEIVMMGGSSKSGPGTAPAPDGMSAEVRVGAEYAIYLEMGTIHMRARPFLGPAAAEVTPMLDGLLRKNLKAEGLI